MTTQPPWRNRWDKTRPLLTQTHTDRQTTSGRHSLLGELHGVRVIKQLTVLADPGVAIIGGRDTTIKQQTGPVSNGCPVPTPRTHQTQRRDQRITGGIGGQDILYYPLQVCFHVRNRKCISITYVIKTHFSSKMI